jgi:hypothetical protein
MNADDPVIAELLARCQRDHHAWINGDGSPYELPEDGSILGAVGGYSFGGADTLQRQRAVARQWRSGTGSVELVNAGRSDYLAWLVMIERATVELVDEQEPRRWDLRVTEIFRLVDGTWQRIHRHADPLVDRRGLADVVHLCP